MPLHSERVGGHGGAQEELNVANVGNGLSKRSVAKINVVRRINRMFHRNKMLSRVSTMQHLPVI